MITYSSQVEIKGGYEYWRETSNSSSSFDQGGSLGAELLFNSLAKPLDYGIGVEWKSEFSGGGSETSLGKSNSNAYPIYLTAKYDLYKDIYAIGRAGWIVFDDEDVNDGFYGAMGFGKKFGKWSVEALYESMDIGNSNDLYSGERVEMTTIKLGYRFGGNDRVTMQKELEYRNKVEEVEQLRKIPIIEEVKRETFNSVVVAVDYEADSKETKTLNAHIFNKITQDLEGKSGILEVRGYTDNSGSEDYNLKLSQERANIVAREIHKMLKGSFLLKDIGKNGKINRPGVIIIPKGYGETSFIIDNVTPENRKRNRRIEIEFIERRSKKYESI